MLTNITGCLCKALDVTTKTELSKANRRDVSMASDPQFCLLWAIARRLAGCLYQSVTTHRDLKHVGCQNRALSIFLHSRKREVHTQSLCSHEAQTHVYRGKSTTADAAAVSHYQSEDVEPQASRLGPAHHRGEQLLLSLLDHGLA
jgi:hypothetical protein